MKQKAKTNRLQARITDWERTIKYLREVMHCPEDLAMKAFKRPGSLKK